MSFSDAPAWQMVVLLALSSAFWMGTLLTVAHRESVVGGRRIFWLLFILLTHWIGAAIYWWKRSWDDAKSRA